MLPFLLQGLLNANFIALVIAWEQFQQLCHGERRPGGLPKSVAAEIRLDNCLAFLDKSCLQLTSAKCTPAVF